MTKDNSIYSYRYRIILGAVILVSLVIAVFAGTAVPTVEKCIIIPGRITDFSAFVHWVVKICCFDVALFWSLSLAMLRPVRLLVSSAMFFYRGLVIGSSFCTVTKNSVSAVALLMLISYSAVTLLAFVYDDYINGREIKGFVTRATSCLVVTGGAVILRIIPMLLIK